MSKRDGPEQAATHQRLDEAARVGQPEHEGQATTVREPEYPRYRVAPGDPVHLADMDPEDSGPYTGQDEMLEELERQRDRISELQERLLAEEERSLLIVLQAMDSGGKDGVGRGVFKGINPQGCNVWSFSKPSEEEQKHDYLWRYHYRVPEAGMIAIFNRSYYEGVLGDRVREEVPEAVWRARYDQINDFERILSTDKVTIVKFFLHISRAEQKRRLEERKNNPTKYWLLSPSDISERERWDAYQTAFEDAITHCTTEHAPWYIVPGNHKWYRNLVIARTIADTLEALDPKYPPLDPELADVTIPD